MSGRTMNLRAIPAPLAREPERRCGQCVFRDMIDEVMCMAPIAFIRMCIPRGDAGRVLVREEDAEFAERAVAALIGGQS